MSLLRFSVFDILGKEGRGKEGKRMGILTMPVTGELLLVRVPVQCGDTSGTKREECWSRGMGRSMALRIDGLW